MRLLLKQDFCFRGKGDLNKIIVSADLICLGRLFQSRGALTANTLSPLVFSEASAIDLRLLPEELKVPACLEPRGQKCSREHGPAALHDDQNDLKIYSKVLQKAACLSVALFIYIK